jgi:2-oxoisovalerate dehydrogenase E1 component
MSDQLLLELFQSQILSRQLDVVARKLRAEGEGYYTISGAGHEGNAVLGEVLRPTDPALVHYRSGAFMIQRARKVPGVDMISQALLGMVASSADPTCGGRHKVWGSAPLWVPPQTSTIGSHLPKAVGMALSVDRAHHLKIPLAIPGDSIVTCSFGDASLNHSTVQGALNTASWTGHQNIPLPLLFVCEDNGLGISVATPVDWVEQSIGYRPHIKYFKGDGLDIESAYSAAEKAVIYCRETRSSAFLHLAVVRLLGHAGSDVEETYRTAVQITEDESKDPLIQTAQIIVDRQLLDPSGIIEQIKNTQETVERVAEESLERPKLMSAEEVKAPLFFLNRGPVLKEAGHVGAKEKAPRRPVGRQRHLASLINGAIHEAMATYPEALVFGEDVAKKGGVYHVTAALYERFGPARVFNTLLDEQSILGMAIGSAQLGFLPMPEIQYLAYLHNAIDQLRGEACSTQFFSNGQFENPMVVRIAGFAYQKGFGGHFHNDNSIGALREIPGLVIAAPARGDDAVKMFRYALSLARSTGRVVAFIEPIALYITKDLHSNGDGLWLNDYPDSGEVIPLGEGRCYHEASSDLAVVSYANGLYFSLQAAQLLEAEGISTRVLDIRWLNPLNIDWIVDNLSGVGGVLIVDECRRAGGVGEAILSGLYESGITVPMRLLAGEDCYLPLGPAMALLLPGVEQVVEGAKQVMGR